MPRFHTILQSEFPYHVGARCINKEWFAVPMPRVWEIMGDQLHFIYHAFNVEILAFVLMSNHFHLIVRTPSANLSEAMGWFMRETSRSLTRDGNRINQTYGGRYFRSVIGSHHYFFHAYKYVYANPVMAGVVRNAVDYPFSTLRGLLGLQRQSIPVQEDPILFNDIQGTLVWLNQLPSDKNWEAVDRALHRREFKLPKVDRQAHSLENDML